MVKNKAVVGERDPDDVVPREASEDSPGMAHIRTVIAPRTATGVQTKYRLKIRRTPPTYDASGSMTDPGAIRKLQILDVTDTANIVTVLDMTALAALGVTGMNHTWDAKPNGLGTLTLHMSLSNIEIDSSDTGN